jgi:very-short-patch-repair endonuclease
MQVTEVLARSGGVADTRTLVAFTSRRRVAAALGRGEIVRDARGRYALPTADQARREAHRLSGVITGASAAAAHGWELKTQPALPTVTVPSKRKVAAVRRGDVDLRWRDIAPHDVWDGVLRPVQTVVDCARTLPFDEALAVADSALRHGAVTSSEVRRSAEQVRTTGRAQALRVAREASGLAANPFESVLRAIALDVPGLDLRPQIVIAEGGWVGRPDLVDTARRLVVEAESFEFHGRRAALRRDCVRYTALTLLGWTVLRFAWEHVMFEPAYVAGCLRAAALGRRRAVGQVTLPRGRRVAG